MAIFSLQHKTITRTSHPPRTASDHLRYVLRASACDEVIVANIPMPAIGSRGGKARAWLERTEDKTRKNGRVIDKIMLALPFELDQAQRVELIHAFVSDICGGEEAHWLAALHDQDSHNPHAHIIFRDQGVKTGKRVAMLCERASTERIRVPWCEVCNEHLAKAGRDARIDNRSLKVQREEIEQKLTETFDAEERARLWAEHAKLDRKPSGHEGPEPRAIEANGEVSTKLKRLRQVRADNAAQRQLEDEMYEVFSPLLQTQQIITNAPPVAAQSDLDQQLDGRWDSRFADRHLRAGLIAILAEQDPHLPMQDLYWRAEDLYWRAEDLYWRAEDILVSAEFNPKHPMNEKTVLLTDIGKHTLGGGWRKLDALAAAVRADAAQTPPLPSHTPTEPREAAEERPRGANTQPEPQNASGGADKRSGEDRTRPTRADTAMERAEAEILDALFCAFERAHDPNGDGWDRTRNPALEWKMALALRALDEQQAELRHLLGERFKLSIHDPRAFRTAITSMDTDQVSSLVKAVDELDRRMDREPGRNWKSRRQTFHQMIERYGSERVLRRNGERPSHIFGTTIKGLCERSGLAEFYRNTLKPLVTRLVDAVRSKQAPHSSQHHPEGAPRPKSSEPRM